MIDLASPPASSPYIYIYIYIYSYSIAVYLTEGYSAVCAAGAQCHMLLVISSLLTGPDK